MIPTQFIYKLYMDNYFHLKFLPQYTNLRTEKDCFDYLKSTCVQEVPHSIFSPGTGYSGWGFLWCT